AHRVHGDPGRGRGGGGRQPGGGALSRTLKVIHVGLGPIGQSIARLTLDRDGLQVVGATDLSVDQNGKDLGVVLGLNRKLRLKVDGNPERFVKKAKEDVAVLCTASSLNSIKRQV